MTKILFFCSPIGLGHATRDLAIINQMELESCKIFSGSSAIQFFQRNDIEANDVYSPPKFEVQNGNRRHKILYDNFGEDYMIKVLVFGENDE